MMNQSGRFNINELVQEAQNRWLKPPEVLFILQNHGNYPFTREVPQKPPSGTLFLYDKRDVPSFRKDGHVWRKKRSGRTVGEGHERLKVDKVETLNCYYAQGEENPDVRRRIYWMLDPAYNHIVLVHYRETSKGRQNANMDQYQASSSAVSASNGTYQSQSSFRPGSSELSFGSPTNNEMDLLDGLDIPGELNMLLDDELTLELQRIGERLSMVDDNMEVFPHCRFNERSKDLEVLHKERVSDHDEFLSLVNGSEYRETDQFSCEFVNGSTFEKHCFEETNCRTLDESQEIEKLQYRLEKERKLTDLSKQYEECISQAVAFSGSNTDGGNSCSLILENSSSFRLSDVTPSSEADNPTDSSKGTSLFHPVENPIEFPYSSGTSTLEANSNYYTAWFDQETQPGTPTGANSRLTVAQEQWFSIREISPEWCYATENSKIIIVGDFLCNPLKYGWACMFGDVQVPAQVIKEGVLLCQAPPHIPGKVALCITTGNREACSEIRDFEYRITPNNSVCESPTQTGGTNSSEELPLLIRFVQVLLGNTLVHNGDSVKLGICALDSSNIDTYPLEHVKAGLLLGIENQSSILYSLLEELLKDKLPNWILSKGKGDTSECSLLKKDQEIIHFVAGLGFDWALNHILKSGIGVNYRDSNGWTALHYAAQFGKEKMAAALIAAGASACAVTDPTSQDPTGQTPGSIAAARGHKGLAGYLSELALTSHLSSLTLEESEISKGNSAIGAECIVESISKESLACADDQLAVKHSLAAVRSAALAAGRIQAAFRQLSFRRRKEKEALVRICEEYGITATDIPALSAVSKLTFPRLREHVLSKAAVVIQKKYRGWKGQQKYLSLRRKIVLIQAHVRGYQTRNKYKVILWAVGVLDKVLLRWRRKGAGLRGFRLETEPTNDEDILKEFRKQKVDAAIEKALSWVMSMVHSSGARKQYRRLLESYREAKAELCAEAASTSQENGNNMDISNNDDIFQLLKERAWGLS